MKRLLSMVALAIITFSSCTKEGPSDSSFISPGSYSPPTISAPVNIELVANNWVNYGPGIYVNTFKDVIASTNASGNRTVTVYLQDNGKQEQISQRHITYMGNELWATNSQSDVSIIYRCSTALPFTSLSIRVQVN